MRRPVTGCWTSDAVSRPGAPVGRVSRRLEYVVGSEQGGEHRPVRVVSNDRFNHAFPVVTVVVPLTKTAGKRRGMYSFEILIPPELVGNPVESTTMPYQIRTIDKTRLLERMGGRLTDTRSRSAIQDRIIEHIGVDLDGADE